MTDETCRAGLLAIALAAFGCSRPPATPLPAERRAPRATAPAAVSKMISGAELAKDPASRDRAIALMREAVATDPKLWEAHYDLGVLLVLAGDLASAEPVLERALALAPDSEEAALALAQVQKRRGEDREAARGLKAFLADHRDAIGARFLYVAALRDAREHPQALEEARALLHDLPGDASALSELSLCELAVGEREQAELLAHEAIVRNHDSAAAHRALGLVALAAGDDAAAFASFRKASELDPKDTTARLNMASVLLRAGVYARAEEQLRAVLVVAKDDLDAQVALAVALRGQADKSHPAKLAEAERVLTVVLAKEPHRIEAQFNLAVLLADFQKRPAEARVLFQRFLSDAPSDHPARAEAARQVKMLAPP